MPLLPHIQSKPASARSGGVRAWLRVTAFFGVLTVGSLSFWVSRVAAQLGEHSVVVGRGLERLHDFVGPATTLRLNGMEFFVSSTVSPAPLKEVLDRFGQYCAEHSGGSHQQLLQLGAERLRKLPEALRPGRFGVLRQQIGDVEGTSACLARDGDDGFRGFLSGMAAFMQTGNLGHIGLLRYVFARRSGDQSHVIFVRTERGFNPLELFPEDRDAPGRDLPEGVRPPQAKRLLFAEVPASPHAVALYESWSLPDEILSAYENALSKRGFRATPLYIEHGRPTARGGPSRAFTKDGAALAVYAESRGSYSMVSVVQLGTNGKVQAWAGTQ